MKKEVLKQLINEAPPEPAAPQPERQPVLEPVAGDNLRELPVNLLEDFPKDKHPFRPYTQEKLEALRRDISERGVIQPLIVRSLGEHRYQIISGHNRRTAASAAGYTALPCIIRRLDDDEAVLQMISTNLQQRSDLRPSEKAFAYKMQMETLKRQAGRPSNENVSQIGTQKRSDQIMAEQVGESRNQIQRYIRLTYLIPPLLDMVDEGRVGLTIGETLSYLGSENQQIVDNFFFSQQHLGIDQRMADTLRELEQSGELTEERLREVFLSSPVKPLRKIRVEYKAIKQYFKADATEKEIEQTIQEALALYFSEKQQTDK
jgi:ParB family chromosome partitioning protein